MKAAFYQQTGPASAVLTVGPLDTPQAGPGEVRVRIRASGVNPSDVKLRSGKARRAVSFDRVVPSNDGAGDIDQVGAGVAASRLGQRVWLYNAQYFRAFGTAAEHIVVPAALAVPLPDGTGYAAGACFGIPLQTAYRAVTLDGPVDGLTILVAGGAGAVGHYAIQIAKAKGATVIATVSSAEKAARAREAGADQVIDYRTEDVAARVLALTGGAGVDRLIEVDLSHNATLDIALVKPHGTIVVYGTGDDMATVPALASIVKSIGYRFFVVYEIPAEPRAAMIADLAAMLEKGVIAHAIGARFPLADIVKAHEAMESGAVIGNIVVEID